MNPRTASALAGSHRNGCPVAPLRAELDLFPIVVAMVLLALAEAFRRGSELARDAEGLV